MDFCGPLRAKNCTVLFGLMSKCLKTTNLEAFHTSLEYVFIKNKRMEDFSPSLHHRVILALAEC